MTEWHVPDEIWRAYAQGTLGVAAESSIEVHVARCPRCRAAAVAHAQPAGAPPVATAVWESVRATVSAPTLPRPVRWLRRLGVPERELVLLSAADAVMLPWVTAVGSALVVALVSGLSGWRHDLVFVALAPLVPVLSVAAAFDATESLREVSSTTPYSVLRLGLLRVSAALAVALPVTAVIGLAIPALHALAGSWVLPGLALTVTALVLLAWLPPWPAAGVVGLAWATLALTAGGSDRLDLVTRGSTQLGLLAVVAGGVAVLVLRGLGPGTTGARP